MDVFQYGNPYQVKSIQFKTALYLGIRSEVACQSIMSALQDKKSILNMD